MRRIIWILAALITAALIVVLCNGDEVAPLPATKVDIGAHQGGASAASGSGNDAANAGGPADRSTVVRELTEYELLLEATATGYTGRVVSSGDEPVPGIGVELLRVEPDTALPVHMDLFARTPASPRLLVADTVTDGKGRFALSGVAPRGLCFLKLAFSDIDRAPPRFRGGQNTFVPVQKTPAPGEVVDLGYVRLKTGATLVGRVVSLDGPIEGALIRAAVLPPLPFGAIPIERLQPGGALIGTAGGTTTLAELPEWFDSIMASLPIASALSRADGSFTVYGVDPGQVVVAATADDYASVMRQGVACGEGQTIALGDLLLPYGAMTEVRVVDHDGEPVAKARVFVAPMSVGLPVHIAEPAGTTDADGIVRVEGLPLGRALAAAQRDGDAAWHIGEPGSAEGRLEVVIPARYTLTLTVQDENERILTDARVRLIAGAHGHGMLELAFFGSRRPTDLGDRLQRLEDGRLRITDLDGGDWTIAVEAPGFGTYAAGIELQADTEHTLQLRPARMLNVRTLGPDGEPVANATIYRQTRKGSRSERLVEMPLAVGRSGDDGWCRVPDLPTEETRLTARHPQFGQVHTEIHGHPTELVMQFATPASIRGVLTDGGRAPAPGRWVLVLERRYGDGALRRGAMPHLPQLAMPDLEGRFEFAALQPGIWRVTAQDSVADVSTVGGFWQYQARRKQIFPWNRADVQLSGGESVDVRLDAIVDVAAYTGPGAAVRGSVTVNGVPAVGDLVVGTSKQPDRRIVNRVDASGFFDFGRVPVGQLRVVLVEQAVADSRLKEHLFSHLYARNIEIENERPVDLAIEIHTGSAFGEVRDDRGVLVANCRVMLYDRGGDGRSSSLRTIRSDDRGAFRFVGIPSGRYELRAEKAGQGKKSLFGIVITRGGVTGPLDVTIARQVKVAGRVVFSTPTPPERAALMLHPADGGAPLRTKVEPDGSFELPAAPVGSYRAEVRVPGATKAAGHVDVVAPETRGLVLTVSG